MGGTGNCPRTNFSGWELSGRIALGSVGGLPGHDFYGH